MSIRFGTLALLLLILTFSGCNGATTTPSTKPTITSFTASPSNLPAGGGSVTLSWNVKAATSLSINNSIGDVTGTSKTVNIASSTTFTLTATNTSGTSQQSTTVTVALGTDMRPPTVISIDPPPGAKGVKDDVSIVITFSEAMNQDATSAAYSSADLPASEVTFGWNTDSTVLSIKPKDYLEYAAGDKPSIDPKFYNFSFTDGGKDLAGNALDPFNSFFTTLKVIVISIYATPELDGDCYGTTGCDTTRASLDVGDLATAPIDSGYRSFLSFDLTSIPTGVIADEAKLIINKEGTNFNADPYALGDMLLEQVDFGDSLKGDDYDTPILADLGIFDSASEPETGYLGKDVTPALNDDLANAPVRAHRSQYRLRFPIENNDNNASDLVTFTSSDGPEGQRPFINIVYYLP